jgi:predicted nuclease with TOPRIM domain
MAITETVNIVFGVVSDELDDSIDKLVRAGKVSKETAAAYKELENSSKKATIELEKLNKEFGENSQEALEAQKRIDELNNKLKKLDEEVKTTAKDFVPLRQRLKEAKEELQKAEAAFGPFSAEAQAARKNAGALTAQLDDLNRQIKLIEPEDKIKAFSNLGQGIVGSFQVATGALQAFGAENERVQEIAQRLQGALNVVQGIQSIIGLKEAYEDVKIILGITTTAQKALTVANEAEAVSAQTAAAANRGLAASLGPIVLILGALAAAYYILADSEEAAKGSTDDLLKSFEELRKEQELQLSILKLQGANEAELIKKRLEFNKINQDTLNSIKDQVKEEEKKKDITTSINDLKRNEKLLNEELKKSISDLAQEELLREQAERERQDSATKGLQSQFESELQNQLKAVDDFANLRKTADLTIIENTKDRENANLVTELESLEKKRQILIQFAKDTELIDAQIAAKRKEIKDKEKEEFKADYEERQKFIKDLAAASFDFIQDLSKASIQAQINDLEQQKEQGIITEEEYQAKLRKIKNDAAKQEKEFSVFAATLAFTEALVKALTTPNPPAALALAAAVGGLNLAKIIATPVPRFKQGTLNVGGGNLDADGGSLAMLHPGEAVIPADRNRSYHPTLKAIYEKQISPSDINAYVLNRLAGRGSIGRDTVTAKVDTYALSKAMSRNKGVQIENAQIVGKAIASELAGRINRRQML